MGRKEAKIEQYLKKEIEKLDGECYKFTSPGRNGVPDRLIIINGYVCFVECKTLEGTLSIRQKREIKKIQNQNIDAYIFNSHDQIDILIASIKKKNFIKYVNS